MVSTAIREQRRDGKVTSNCKRKKSTTYQILWNLLHPCGDQSYKSIGVTNPNIGTKHLNSHDIINMEAYFKLLTGVQHNFKTSKGVEKKSKLLR